VKAEGEIVELEDREPLRVECEHFIHCVNSRTTPVTHGMEGLRVLRALDACQHSLDSGGGEVEARDTDTPKEPSPYFVHESACVDDGAEVGIGTKIWHFSHIMKGARIGERCVIGQN